MAELAVGTSRFMDNNSANFIWNIADLLRGSFQANDYGKVIIPFTILRRMDCMLESTKQAVLDAKAKFVSLTPEMQEAMISNAADAPFYNTSPYTFTTLLEQPSDLRENLLEYISSFSSNVEDIYEEFELRSIIEKLAKNNLLYLLIQKFASADFHPETISNHEMGLLFEELIRRFTEDQAADNGEYYTPRDAIRLVAEMIIAPDREELKQGAPIRRVYDPTAGTGGMLSGLSELINGGEKPLNEEAEILLFGQELSEQSHAICKADMIAKGQKVENIKQGNTLTNDQFAGEYFDYIIANPPYGSNWEREKEAVTKEHKDLGFEGRFGPGLPSSSDGQLLFLLHAVSKLRPKELGGGRAGIVMNGSSLFNGDAGSGPSNIRRWLFENDLVDAIVALPTNMFYGTGIATYVWLIDNNKPTERQGKVQLIDGSKVYSKMRKNLGDKSRELNAGDIKRISTAYLQFEDARQVSILKVSDSVREWNVEFDLDTGHLLLSDQFGSHGRTGVVEIEQEDGDVVYAPMVSAGVKYSPKLDKAGNAEDGSEALWLASAIELSRIFPSTYFGYRVLTVEQPLKRRYFAYTITSEEEAEDDLLWWASRELQGVPPFETQQAALGTIALAAKQSGKKLTTADRTRLLKWMEDLPNSSDVVSEDPKKGILPDSELRDTEVVPLDEDEQKYLAREVYPYASEAWVDDTKTKVGYEVSFNRIFYVPEKQRTLEELNRELKQKQFRLVHLLQDLA